MFIVTVDELKFTYFNNVEEANIYAENENNKYANIDDGCVSYTMYPRVVIHELQMNIEYTQDYLQTEIYAIKIYNDST